MSRRKSVVARSEIISYSAAIFWYCSIACSKFAIALPQLNSRAGARSLSVADALLRGDGSILSLFKDELETHLRYPQVIHNIGSTVI